MTNEYINELLCSQLYKLLSSKMNDKVIGETVTYDTDIINESLEIIQTLTPMDWNIKCNIRSKA